ncbi:MAG: efflux RND transporter periplasmic adaptor subunit [Cyclobacteriaceae bacterium]|nr:efflux RND transporter periplasmic adaptor subunit [Cyclobacteriaceae bacterium]
MNLPTTRYPHGIMLLLLVLMAACEPGTDESPETTFVLTETISKDKELAEAVEKVVQHEISLTGKVNFNENTVARVFPLAGGFVEELTAEIGDYVQKGQTLAIIRSPEIAGFIQENEAAQSRLQVAEKNAAVTEALYETGNASEVQLVNDIKELDRAKGEAARAEEVLRLYGASGRSSYAIRSPMSGFVIQKNISLNMELRTEDISPAFVVGSLDEVWVMANVYESEIALIKVGQEVNIKTIAYPDRIYPGKIDKIFNTMDPISRVLRARVTIQNKDNALKPEMFAQIIVRFEGPQQRIAIPSRAIIFDKGRHFVMVYFADDRIETREVRIYQELNGEAFLDSGIKAGEKVMTKYQLLVYDALND